MVINSFICRKFKNLTNFTLRGHELSPVKHLYLKGEQGDAKWEQKVLTNIGSEVSCAHI
jgi:hypothetical protein